ncbi:MAG: Vitamin B12 dependent methionine synthase activation subunit [Clostridia bacterium]|nr:Vitamin B12 dependent methionine synthase activation subunit [Clostridia bacterium]
MSSVQIYDSPPVCKNEILRYAGCKTEADLPEGLLESCIEEAKGTLTYRVCFLPLCLKVSEDVCDFGSFSVNSKGLAKNLEGCEKAVVFAATIGVGIDRLISKYSAVSPARALLFQALGAERIEALCDVFCADLQNKTKLYTLPRFSPGYGDFDLLKQKDIFKVLDCNKLIGLTLSDSMIMSPSKSVTAITGLTKKPQDKVPYKCNICTNKNCAYRGKK